MRPKRKPKHRSRSSGQLMAMTFMGAGLLILGAVAFVMLPRPQAAASEPSQASGAEPAIVDFAAPELKLTDLNGQPVSLADYQDQVVLVNNWATWCPPCKAEMPTLQAYYEAHHDEGFTIVAIDAGDPVDQVAAFVDAYQLTFPVWPDLKQKSLQAFRNMSLPSSYVINRSGRVSLAWSGAVSMEKLEKFVTPLLEE